MKTLLGPNPRVQCMDEGDVRVETTLSVSTV